MSDIKQIETEMKRYNTEHKLETLKNYNLFLSKDNIDKRLAEHNRGKTPFTKTGIPWILVYKESFLSRTEAFRREKYIKNQKSVIYIKSLLGKFSSTGSEHLPYKREVSGSSPEWPTHAKQQTTTGDLYEHAIHGRES